MQRAIEQVAKLCILNPEVNPKNIPHFSLHPGFFTSVSSNGNANPIIWAVAHPNLSSSYTIRLYAFDPEVGGATLKQIFHAPAGTWPNINGNSNIVPTVANG